ncbi:methyl-accepting chemotaxis protein [Pelagibius sp. Alg239-R121]|uniref:methyl-accepting chemotaxis protein n=1 Tax=Pelagibius sp. Alg239-R121 TaxID=2993448 RepID=UPI0024A628D4|nr:methyl-accepting chemotaxis protein [Pelagibius sp. Alg239-R121]
MKSARLFTIRNSLIAICSILIVAVASFATTAMFSAISDRHLAEQISDSNALADLLVTSAGNWAVERGVTNAALANAKPASDEVKNKISARRQSADTAFLEALDKIQTGDLYADQQVLGQEVEAAYKSVVAFRENVDVALSREKVNRSTDVLSGWVPNMTGLIMQSKDLRVAISRVQTGGDQIGQLAMLKHFSWVMSEYAGRERAIIGGLVAGEKRMTAAQLRKLSGFRGQVEAAWDSVRSVSDAPGTPAAIAEAIREAEANFFGSYQATRDAVYKAGTYSAAYDMTALEWIDAATAAIDTLLVLDSVVSNTWRTHGVGLEGQELTDNLMKAAGNWAVERGVTNGALQSAAPASDGALKKIESRRQAADQAFEAAITQLSNWRNFDGKDKLIAEVKEAYTQIAALRSQVDDALAQNKSQRPKDLPLAWVPAASRLIVQSQNLMLGAVEHFAEVDPLLGVFVSLRHDVWAMAEYAGRERAIMGGIIGARVPITDAQLQVLSRYRGRVESAWDAAQLDARNPSLPAQIKLRMSQVRTSFFEIYQSIREERYAEATSTSAYPMNGPEWVATATAAIDSLLKIQSTVSVATGSLAETSKSDATNTLIFEAVLLAVILAVGAVSAWVVIFRVTVPINGMTTAMKKLAGGDLETEVPSVGRQDEIGDMAEAVEVFKANAKEVDRMKDEEEERKRASDEKLKTELLTISERLDKEVKAAVSSTTTQAEGMKETSTEMTEIVGRLNQRASTVSDGASQANESIQTVASAAEELSASISEITRQVGQSSTIVQKAADEANRTDETVGGLADAAQKIGDVINLIQDIAEQTNLLALNATIEAARAGDAGKGFAVVASEVKNLANQTAKATEEIGSQIGAIRTETEGAVQAIRLITETIKEVNTISDTISEAVEQQSQATQEISESVQSTVRHMTEVTGQISDVAEDTKAVSDHSTNVMTGAKGTLTNIDHLDKQMGDVLKELRESAVGNRRKDARQAGSWPITLDADGISRRGQANDLSLGGALINCEGELSTGQSINVEIGNLSKKILATVVECSSRGVHISFEGDEETRALIGSLLSQQEQNAA